MRKFMKSLFFAACAAGMTHSAAIGAEIYKPKAVVELFTSQGCHSCPPADKIIGKFSKGKEVLGLSWHVDYWDYLGWKDTFASRSNTERQYSYARALRERQVYTPQAVINGRTHEVGSRENRLVGTINSFTNTNKGMNVPIDANLDGESLSINIESATDAANSTLYIIYFDSQEEVKIDRGENTGKTITYHNIVKKIQPLGMVKSSGLTMDFPVSEIKREGTDSAALILQKLDGHGEPSAIVGALVLADL